MGQMRQVASELGLPFGDRQKTYNSRLAQELGLWAETCGMGEAFHDKAFRAYFEGGKNIAKVPVLLDLAESAGLSRSKAAGVLSERSFGAAVDADWALSKKMGITAVPTFVMGGERLVGAQAYEKLAAFVTSNGA